MDKASFSLRTALLCIMLVGLTCLTSCDNPFINDGDDDQGITELGGYFYFIDNEAFMLRMLDRNLATVKSWSLEGLGANTAFQGIACDGDNLWLSVAGSIDRIYQVDATGDELVALKTYPAPPEAHGTVRDIAWHENYLWVLNSGSETYALPPTLYKMNPDDGLLADSIVLPLPEPRGLAAVEDNADAYGTGAPPGLYISDVELDTVYSYRTDKMMFGAGFASPIPPRGESYVFPVGICFNGSEFWLINSSSYGDQLYALSYEGLKLQMVEIPWMTPGPIVWSETNMAATLPPAVLGAAPNTAARDNDVLVTITGNYFQPGTGHTVSFGAGITVSNVTYVSSTTLTCQILVASDAEFGARSITVTNPDGQSGVGVDLFTVLAVDPNAGYIWWVEGTNDTLYKVRISDTSIVQTWSIRGVAPGGSPQGLTFDGANIWLCAAGTDDQLIKLNTSGVALTAEESFTAPPNATGTAREITYDGENLWCANNSSAHIYKMDYTTGAVLDSVPTPGAETRGLVFANGDMYCTDRTTDSVYVYNFTSGTWTGLFETPIPPNGTADNRYVTGMCFDGINFWMCNSTYEFDYLFQVSMDGVLLRTYGVPNQGDATPSGVTFTQD